MQVLIWGGSALTLLGVALLMWCVRMAAKVRQSGQDDPLAAQQALTRVLFWNMGALGLSALGLMAVVIGIILG